MAREEYIRIYRSTTEGVTPSLTSGEIAANLADGNLFIGGSNGDLITYPQIPINANSLSGSIESLSVHSGNAFLSVPIRTNLIKYSQDYVVSGNNYWNAYGTNDAPDVSNLGAQDENGWPGKGSTGGISLTFKGNPNNGIYQLIPGIVKNQVYTVSCWARSSSGNTTARFSYFDGELNRSIFSPDYRLTTTPQRVSFTFRAQSNNASSNIAFGNGSGNVEGTVLVWGFQLEQGWIATSPIHNDTGAPKQSAAEIVKVSSSFDTANFLMDDQGIVKLSATGTVPNTISTGLGASANADGSLAYLYFDPANLTFSSETTIDPNHDFLIFYDSNQAGLVKTKRIKPSKFMLDNDSIFSSKSSQFVKSKSSSNIEFEILTAGISAGETNLLTSGDAYTYITQNTIKSLNGQTGDVAAVGSLNGCTGTITITGTTNEVVISNSCPTITIGLPDNVSIPHLSVVGATFTGQVTLPNGQTLGDGVVTTVNGGTGAVQVTGSGAILHTISGTTTTFDARLASSSVTGVASFNNIRFTATTTGHIDLAAAYQVTGDTVQAGSFIGIDAGKTITNTGVHTINGVTGAITNVAKTNVDNNFSDSQTISAPFGRLKVENTILGGTAEYLSSNINFYNGSNSQTFLPSLTNPTNTIIFPDFTTTLVGLAGTQTFTGTKTFNTLTNFNAGISAAGATFSGDIVVNGGDITTTASTATLYNTNAATVAIGGSAGSITISSGNTAGLTFGVGSYHKFKTNRVETVTTSQTEIFRFNYINASFSSVGGLDAAYAEIIITAERTTGLGACSGTQITKLLIASNPADGTVFHTEYGNVNTNGNLASYTASVSGNDVIVYATPTSLDETVFKVLATLIRGEFGEGI